MVLDKLKTSLGDAISKITSSLFVDEKLILELVKDIQRALLQSDVNVKLVLEISAVIKERALKEDSKSLNKKEHLLQIVYEELVKFLGGESEQIIVNKKPFTIMLVGLFGAGKTTTAGKLSHYYNKRFPKVAALQLDVWRPAAFEQIKQIGIYSEYQKKLENYDVVLIDTAGRDALSPELITELTAINKKIMPDERFLVLSADIGQAAEKQATMFHDTVDITGVVATKMEGTAKGGGTLSACSISNSPVKFLGVGEKIDDIETFNAKRFVSRLLGMGDIETLLEKASEIEHDEDLANRFLEGNFTLIDMYENMKMTKKFGSLSKIMDLIPGMNKMGISKTELKKQEQSLEVWKHILNSCTQEELENPDIINGNRINRIADGSGTKQQDVKSLLSNFKSVKKLSKSLKGNDKRMQKVFEKMGLQ